MDTSLHEQRQLQYLKYIKNSHFHLTQKHFPMIQAFAWPIFCVASDVLFRDTNNSFARKVFLRPVLEKKSTVLGCISILAVWRIILQKLFAPCK